MNYRYAINSHKGGRDVNQDYCDFVRMGEAWCWVVADGLGGHRGGEIASKAAVENIIASFREDSSISHQALRRHLERAQDAILAYIPSYSSSMRTTVVVLLANEGRCLWGHVGDSRLYHFRKGKIVFQTLDHSVPQVMSNAGDISPEEIRFHEDRNRLLRSLGKAEKFRPEILQESRPIERGDAFLLCTDGFWDYVTEPEMEKDLSEAASPEPWLDKMERRITSKAEGEYDNYTAIAVFAVEKPHTTAQASGKRKRRLWAALIVAVLVLFGMIGTSLLEHPKEEESTKPAPSVQKMPPKKADSLPPRKNMRADPHNKPQQIAGERPRPPQTPLILIIPDAGTDTGSDVDTEQPSEMEKTKLPEDRSKKKRTVQ